MARSSRFGGHHSLVDDPDPLAAPQMQLKSCGQKSLQDKDGYAALNRKDQAGWAVGRGCKWQIQYATVHSISTIIVCAPLYQLYNQFTLMHINSMIYIYIYNIYIYILYIYLRYYTICISAHPFHTRRCPRKSQKPVEPGGAAGAVAPKKYAPWSGRGTGWHVTGVTSKKEGKTELK